MSLTTVAMTPLTRYLEQNVDKAMEPGATVVVSSWSSTKFREMDVPVEILFLLLLFLVRGLRAFRLSSFITVDGCCGGLITASSCFCSFEMITLVPLERLGCFFVGLAG